MPTRIEADVALLDDYVQAAVDLATGRRRALEHARAALDEFFSSSPVFGPTSSPVFEDVQALLDHDAIEARRVQATAEAFREAEMWMAADPLGSWRPDDDWLEARVHRWLHEHHPEALSPELAPIGPFSTLHGLVDAIAAWRGGDDDPVLQELHRTRSEMMAALALGEGELDAYLGFGRHFDVFDVALGSAPDGRVSPADLEHVVANPTSFTPAQVRVAQAVLGAARLRNRLDTAAGNVDIVDPEGFGSRRTGDGLISREDIQAFMVGAHLNHVLSDHAAGLDTAARGGAPDGIVSRRDLEHWLADPAQAEQPLHVRDAVQQMLDTSLFHQSWWEVNREAVAMGAAAAAGGAVIFATGGTAAPLVTMGAGFVAGATSAAGATAAINHRSGNSITDGALASTVNGGFVGMAVAGIPAAPLANGAAAVGGGGVDIVVPNAIETRLHDGANVVSLAAGLPGYRTRVLSVMDDTLGTVPIEDLAEVTVEGLGHAATAATLREE